MISAFEDYQKEPESLTMEQMKSIHESMKEEIGDDPDAIGLYQELVEKASEYCGIRATWYSLSREERMDKDSSRTAKHDSVITHLNMLARYLRSQGHSAAWRDEIATEEEGYGRKRIGDFACYITFVNAVNAR